MYRHAANFRPITHTPKQIPLAFVQGIDAEEKTEGDSVALVITLCSTSFTVRRNFADRLSYSVQTADIRDAQARSRTTFDFSIFMLKLRMDGNMDSSIHSWEKASVLKKSISKLIQKSKK